MDESEKVPVTAHEESEISAEAATGIEESIADEEESLADETAESV